MTIRQLKMLGIDGFLAGGITVEEALDLNQLTFGSLCYRRWIIYDAKRKRFVHSQEGSVAFQMSREITNFRKNNNHLFSVRVPEFINQNSRRGNAIHALPKKRVVAS